MGGCRRDRPHAGCCSGRGQPHAAHCCRLRRLCPGPQPGKEAPVHLIYASKGPECRLAQVHPWVIWCYWASPLMYAQQALSISEFSACELLSPYSAMLWQLLVLSQKKMLSLAARWQKPNPDNPAELLGPAVLQSRGFFTEHWFVWLSIGALAAYALLFNALILLAMSYTKRLALCGLLWLTHRSIHLRTVLWCSPWGCGGTASRRGID